MVARKRLTPEESRGSALEAARALLIETGPQAVTLKAVATGHFQLVDIFVQVDHREERPFFGDTTLWQCLDGMASGKHPLIFVSGPGRLPLWNPPRNLAAWEVLVTEAGVEVLEGKKDAIELNGIDRWMGGVHLCRGKPIWRWDEQERKLVKKEAP